MNNTEIINRTNPDDYIAFKDILINHTNILRNAIERIMPDKGNTSTKSQKITLLNALMQFEHCINGIERNDIEKEK